MKWLAVILALIAPSAYGQVITPSSQPVSSAPSIPSAFVPGRFYMSLGNGTPANFAVGAANRLFLLPFFVPSTSTAKTLSFDIGTGNASAWNARMCIYADTSSAGSSPTGSLVANGDTGTIAVASGSVTGVQSGNLNSTSGIQLIGPAWYWLGWMADSASESVYSITGSVLGPITSTFLGGESAARVLTNNVTGVYVTQTFGACPATFSGVTYNAAAGTPAIAVGF